MTDKTLLSWEVRAAACLISSYRTFLSDGFATCSDVLNQGGFAMGMMACMNDATNSGVFPHSSCMSLRLAASFYTLWDGERFDASGTSQKTMWADMLIVR